MNSLKSKKWVLCCFSGSQTLQTSPPCKSKYLWYSLLRIATGKHDLSPPTSPPSLRRVLHCKTLTSGLEPCSPPQQPTQLRPCAPHLHSLFRMILIDSFIDCKEIGCSYNTAGLFGVMKKGMWPWACCTDGERGKTPCQLHGWQLFILKLEGCKRRF